MSVTQRGRTDRNIWRRGEIWYFRKRLPPDIAGRLGQREIRVSLQTGRLVLAEVRAARLKASFAPLIHDLAGLLADDGSGDRRDVSGAIAAWQAASIQWDEGASVPFTQAPGRSPRPDDMLLRLTGMLADALRAAGMPAAIPVEPGRDGCDPEPVDVSASGAPMTMQELCHDFLRERPDLAMKSAMDHRTAADLFHQIVGPVPVAEITRSHVIAFRDGLSRVPNNYRKRFGTGDVLDAIALNEALPEDRRVAPIHAKTINNKYLSALRGMLGHARTAGFLEGSPADGISQKVPRTARRAAVDERDPFSDEQLRQFFCLPLFLGAEDAGERGILKPGSILIGDHRFWVPLIGLFSGLRLNEIGQLRAEDIVTLNGRAHFHVHDAVDGNSVKTAAGWRHVPVHRTLIDLGLHDLTTGAKKARLFPGWKLSNDGTWSSSFSKFFSRLLVRADIKTAKTSFHSLRHTFKSALIAAEIPKELRDRYMGHAGAGMEGRYGGRDLAPWQSEAIDRVAFPAVNLAMIPRRQCIRGDG